MHRRRGSKVFRMAIMVTALVAGVFNTTGCTTYRLREPTTTAPEDLVGKTVQFVFAADSLTLKVARIEGQRVFGRVVTGSGPAAIQLAEVTAARAEDLGESGRAQVLQMDRVRRDPTVLEGASVWFETSSGDVLLREIHVGADGWIAGRVASNDPAETSVAASTRIRVISNGDVRIELDRTRGYSVRTVDPGRTVSTTLARTLLVVFGLVLALAIVAGTSLDLAPP